MNPVPPHSSPNQKRVLLGMQDRGLRAHFSSTSTPILVNQVDSGYFEGHQSVCKKIFASSERSTFDSLDESKETCGQDYSLNKHCSTSLKSAAPLATFSCTNSKSPTSSIEYNGSLSLFDDELIPSKDSKIYDNSHSENIMSKCELSLLNSSYFIKDRPQCKNNYLVVNTSQQHNVTNPFISFSDNQNTLATDTYKSSIEGTPFCLKIPPIIKGENELISSANCCSEDSQYKFSDKKTSKIDVQALNCVSELDSEQSGSMCSPEMEAKRNARTSSIFSTSFDVSFSSVMHNSSISSNFCGKVGDKYVDFISELLKKNCVYILKILLSYFQPKDLCQISWVSKQWRMAVFSDQTARQKREMYVKHKKKSLTGPNKENLKVVKKEKEPSALNREVLVERKNIFLQAVSSSKHEISDPSLTSKSRFQYFLEETKDLKKGERIQKCPCCRSPCRVTELEQKGKCSTPSCNYEFCVKCFFRYHKNRKCPSLISGSPPTVPVIFSKKSRRNLRRL